MSEAPRKFHEYRMNGTVNFPLTFYYQHYLNARHEIIPHRHSQYEVNYICDGSLTLFLGTGGKILLQKGDAVYIAPNQYHSGFSDSVFKKCVIFDGTLLTGVDPRNGAGGLGSFLEKNFSDSAVIRAGDPIIRDTVLPLFDALEHPAATLELDARASLYRFFSLLYGDKGVEHALRTTVSERRLSQISSALKLVCDEYSQPISLKRMADTAGLEEHYFDRIFKSVMHMSPIEYLMQYRVAQAVRLLPLPDYTVAQIAALCGFASPEYFSRVFRAHRGMSPTEFASGGMQLIGGDAFYDGGEHVYRQKDTLFGS